MKRIKVRYDDFLVIENTLNVVTDNCNSITFENIGTDNATILDNIPLLPGEIRQFNNFPGEIIPDPFKIRFADSDPDKQILVIREFKDIIDL